MSDKDDVGPWVKRPIKCEACKKIIEGTAREFSFYCDDCIETSIAVVRAINRGVLKT